MLKYAVMYGADAVYLAGTRFGARKFANNFNDEELVEAVRFAHLYGVKVYVTINTLIYEHEVDDFISYVKFIYKVGVDAVLVQDFGMMALIRKVVPDLEIHASTQMHNNGKNIVKLLKEYGVSRVVVDREMSLNEIKDLGDIEKEVFCHGALCVSYSGQCLLSSFILNRSGNRGECAGLCRLPYRTLHSQKSKYYLSLKDICTANFLDKILDTGVSSLKIEGRMKSPEYVGYITSIYRKLLDSYYEGCFKRPNNEEIKNMKLLFNRGFTDGYIASTPDEKMVNRENPNHIGIHLGKYEVHKNKIKLMLEEDLEQGDGIRFSEDSKGMTVNFLYDKNDKLISHADAFTIAFVDNFLGVANKGELRKVSSVKLNEMINNLPKRTVKITGALALHRGKNVCLKVSDGINEVTLRGVVVDTAVNRPITREEVEKQITKTGSTIYEFSKLEIDLESNCFINIKDLNDLRRKTLEGLDRKRMSNNRDCNFGEYHSKHFLKLQDKVELNVVVDTIEQLDALKNYDCNIFSANKELIRNEEVNPKYSENPKLIKDAKYIISDLGSLIHVKKGDSAHSDYMLNVVNAYTVEALLSRGITSICMSIEASLNDIKNILKKNNYPLEVLVYGHIELAKLKLNPLKEEEGDYLIDRNKSKYFIKRMDDLNYILSPTPVDRIDEISSLLKLGINKIRIDFTTENGAVVKHILDEVLKRL